MLLCILNVAICVFVCRNILDVSRHSKCCNLCICSVSHNGGGSMGGCPPLHHMIFFFKIPPSKLMPPPSMGHPPLKNEAPHWKVKHPSRKLIIEKKPQKKLETVIVTCVSLMKQHWRKMAEIPQKCDFLTWSIQNFIRKVKQFARKTLTYLINWLT